MDEYELSKLIQCACAGFDVKWNIVAIDEWPTIDFSTLPVLVITNTAKRADKGIHHWLCFMIYKDKNGQLKTEVFDSLGLSLNEYNIAPQFAIDFKSSRPIQSKYSYSCGVFCVNYAFFRLRKHSLLEIENTIFNPLRLEENEKNALCVVRQLKHWCTSVHGDQKKQLLSSSLGLDILNSCKNSYRCQQKLHISNLISCFKDIKTQK